MHAWHRPVGFAHRSVDDQSIVSEYHPVAAILNGLQDV
jgi:hypothetical protein